MMAGLSGAPPRPTATTPSSCIHSFSYCLFKRKARVCSSIFFRCCSLRVWQRQLQCAKNIIDAVDQGSRFAAAKKETYQLSVKIENRRAAVAPFTHGTGQQLVGKQRRFVVDRKSSCRERV